MFSQENRYQMGNMDDSAEILLSLLKCIHNYRKSISLQKEDDNMCIPLCPSHSSFYIQLLEQDSCNCGWNTEVIPYDFNYFAYEVYTIQVLERLKESHNNEGMMSLLKKLNVNYGLI